MRRPHHAGRTRSGGLSLNVFTPDEIDDIHVATLEVLERTGVFVEDDEPLDIFADGGCLVDRDTRMVRMPPHVVAESWPPARRPSPTAAVRPTATSSSNPAA